MGSGPSPEPSMHGSTPMQHSSLIQLDDDIRQSLEEDTIRFESDTQLQNDLYSPDGDNEVAYPYESIFEGFHMQQDSDSFHWH
ncbi:hypothetical protein G6F68_018921 [Rhizopus microsporus]|nr:hypothetical protein G6F68_018921 [Rhizopus microsporus]